jgi:WD40 repeat protein/tRNA A-37 threonylcarbamoyl transferase component Bud32
MTQMNSPQYLGNYKLLRIIGRGGFATVYLGKHIHMKSHAAVKVLHSRLGSEEEARRFRREAETIARLSHPNIIRVLDFDVREDIAFLVMEYAPFGSLRQQYPGVMVPLPAVVSYVQQVAGALQYAHDQKVIHRDVKPENMLVARNHGILLSDFGLALLAQSMSNQSTQTMQDPAGTIAYMAPEQIQGKPRPASDQYALAVTVYEWLCGRRPFEGTAAEVTAKHLSLLPPPLRTHVPTIPPDLECVVLQALAKAPKERFARVQEFADALEEAAGVEPRPLSMEHFTTVPIVRQSSRETAVLTRSLNRGSRKLATVPTIMQGEPATSSRESRRQPLVSRRTILLGFVALIGAGGAGIALAAQQRGSATIQRSLQMSTGAAKPTALPTKVPTPTAGPKPTHAPATAPSKPGTTPATDPQPPTPTPDPVPAGTLYVDYQNHANAVYTVAWSPDGTRIASGGSDHTAQVWRAADGSPLYTYTGHTGSVDYVAWSLDSTRVASASDDKTIQVWDATNGTLFFECNGHTDNVHCAVWSPDGRRIASGSGDTTVKVWDAATGTLLLTYTGHTATVWAVAWSPDGTRIASASGNPKATIPDNTVKVWDVATGATLLTYTGHTNTVIYVAWSPDGRHCASGSADATVRIWDATTGNTRLTYHGHTGAVYGVAWSPDGTRIASGSVDTTVQIWDVINNVTTFTYRGHSSTIYDVAWSPDGTRIVSGSGDTTVQVWQV